MRDYNYTAKDNNANRPPPSQPSTGGHTFGFLTIARAIAILFVLDRMEGLEIIN